MTEPAHSRHKRIEENRALRLYLQEARAQLRQAQLARAELEKKFLSKNKELRHIYEINSKLISSVPTGDMYSMVARTARSLMDADICVLRVLDEETGTLQVVANRYIGENVIKDLPPVKLGEAITGKAAQERKPVMVCDIDKAGEFRCHELVKIVRRKGVQSVLAVPIVFRGKTLGVITTYSRRPSHFSCDKIKVLTIFASHIALTIQEAAHYREIHLTYFNTMRTLVLTLETRDPYTHGHTERVTKYAMDVGYTLGLSQDELDTLRYAAEVHDIGKISIPDFVLNKPDKLNNVERSIIELHPVKGADILAPLEFLCAVIPIVKHHHERYDGTGYPNGLKKEKIPYLARILTCVDSFDAMTSDRPYRSKKLTIAEAFQEIKHNIGTQFDPAIARLFMKMAKTYKYK